MKYLAMSAAALAVLAATPAAAQQYTFPQVRGDVDVGLDRFYSEGNNHHHLGVGGSLGADIGVGGFVLGAEGTYWWAPNENITRDGPGIAYRKSFQEWGAAIRAGVLASPATLVYVKGGLVVNEQRKYFDADPVATPGIPVNDAYGDYYNHYKTRGYTVGIGAEHLLNQTFYVKGEGRYSNYRTNSSRIALMLGAGVRFGPAVEVMAPPPPPPPPPAPEPAPATQTCYDGSVILATDVCPTPPPPPPPPPAPERG